MRLSSLHGFEFRPQTVPNNGQSDSSSLPREFRLVAYTASQAKPIYISEPLPLSMTDPSVTNTFSFEDMPWKREFLLAVQLQADGSVQREWIMDLRHARSVKSIKDPHELLLVSDNGLMSVTTNDLSGANGIDHSGTNTPHLSPKVSSPNLDGIADLTVSSYNGEDSSFYASANTRTLTRISDADPAATKTLSTLRTSTSMETFMDSKKQQLQQQTATASGSLLSRWLLPSWAQGSQAQQKGASSRGQPLISLSYSTLVDIWTLQKILDEAQAASKELCRQINELLPESQLSLEERETQLRMRLHRMSRRRALLKAETASQRERSQSLKEKHIKIQELLDESFDLAKSREERLTGVRRRKRLFTEDRELPRLIRKEQARLASQLLEIFPIEPLADGKFHFAIRGLILPSVFAINHFDTTQIAAALGFVAQVIVSLSRYLDIALPYPITVCGSQSYITDNISLIKHGSTKFPLWTRGALLYRVEYALYLLHKDIDRLMTSLNLAVADLKQTLANLKNALLVVSSYA